MISNLDKFDMYNFNILLESFKTLISFLFKLLTKLSIFPWP